MVLNSPFTKSLYINLPPLLLCSSLSGLSERLPSGLQPSFCPKIKLNSQLIFFGQQQRRIFFFSDIRYWFLIFIFFSSFNIHILHTLSIMILEQGRYELQGSSYMSIFKINTTLLYDPWLFELAVVESWMLTVKLSTYSQLWRSGASNSLPHPNCLRLLGS